MKHTLFKKLKFEKSTDGTGLIRASLDFENGYTASVITGLYAYANDTHPYELAVIKDGKLCYDTPITNDVIGYCNEDMIEELLQKIKALPKIEEVR